MPPEPRERFTLPGLRWYIIGTIFLATLINLLDRLTISVLAPVIKENLGLTNLQFASIGTWFLAAYTISQGLSGHLYDRWSTRVAFTVSVTVWSLAAIATAFTRGLASLSVVRFVLGLGEAGNWPGAAKVIAEWFPARQRALGMAIFNSGAVIGAIVAPPLIVWLQLTFGWRAAFLATGFLGFVWIAVWHTFYRPVESHPWLRDAERETILRERAAAKATPQSWSSLLRFREVWAIVGARFLTDPIWWLYITWLPLYLYNSRGFSLKEIGLFAWMPYVAADAGSLVGGWSSGFLISRGWSVGRARKTVIVVSAVLMCAGLGAPRVASAGAALALIGVVLFGFQAWINNVQTLPSDLFPAERVASVAGLGGAGAGVGSMIFTLGTGWVVDKLGSYTPVIVTAGLLPLAGTALLLSLIGQVDGVTGRVEASGA
jgi:MFS transporter, ACS family, hexuronate transporter